METSETAPFLKLKILLMMKLLYSTLVLFALFSCQTPPKQVAEATATRNTEAREDSLKYTLALEERNKISHIFYPSGETQPVKATELEDAADDPALWINKKDPDRSVVFGTNKKGGIYAYDASGNEIFYYQVGEINNIDVRQDILAGNQRLDVLGGSNRTDNSIVLYQIDSSGNLKALLDQNFIINTNEIDEVYGFCLYKKPDQSLSVVINGKNGMINGYDLVKENTELSLNKTSTWKINSQPEGMVADDELGVLYVGEEENGIWRIDLRSSGIPVIIEDSKKSSNPFMVPDLEGLAIYYGDKQEGFLLASVQGSFSYALFDRTGTNRYLGSFIIPDGMEIDGVEETDGLDIFSTSFGKKYPAGLLVVQDGFNYDHGELKSQNFKYISLETVIELYKQLKAVP
jgi:3-phytase